MKKMTDSYVIGLSPHNLLDIEFGFDWNSGSVVVRKIFHGMMNVDEATIIGGEENAYKVLKEIQDRYDSIFVSAPTIIQSLVDGNDIDPMQLHIYEVRVGREVM